ncbi:MAG: CHAT domain-containing protein [Deltaproteobacteria bacterium]|nr:MAG: CHAT domain-containing protein [Deltaproteobacteria bacterium]
MTFFATCRPAARLALLLLLAWPAAGLGAADCRPDDRPVDYGAITRELDEKLGAGGLSAEGVFDLRACRVQVLIDQGETAAAEEALGALQAEAAAAPHRAVRTRLLAARLAAGSGRTPAAAEALAAAMQQARTPEEAGEAGRTAGRLAGAELPRRPDHATLLLAAVLPATGGETLLPVKVEFALRLLAARAALAGGDRAAARGHLDRAEQHAAETPAAFPADALLALGKGLQEAGLPAARTWYQAGAAAAGQSGDAALLSLALGRLGHLDEQDGTWENALRQTRAALFHAQAVRDQELVFTWQWQQARILRGMRQLDGAVAMNRMAVETLQGFRADRIAVDPDFFRTTVRPAYLDLADLLLTKARDAAPDEKAALLRQAVATVELLRSDELKDYLKLPCLPVNDLDLLAQRDILRDATVVYLIDFDDRIGIVARKGDTLVHSDTPVSTRQVKAEAFLLAESISRVDDRFRESARRLYRWLLAPLEAQLAGSRVLIVVPDGATRAIPFAALLDGDRYLIEKYAVVMNQGLSVTTAGEGGRYGSRRFFLGGISEAVASFNAIPRVAEELQAINGLYPADLMRDRQFTTGRIKEQLQGGSHPVVHLASHGQISGDVADSYILTWDGKLNIADLSAIVKSGERQNEVIDLITLSACSTAVGDDRATLGLAGVALKAGARSAIASLWNVDDEATERFFVTFYDLLRNDRQLGKAEAIRTVQRQYLAGEIAAAPSAAGGPARDFTHPFFWAPFVLTGNWE